VGGTHEYPPKDGLPVDLMTNTLLYGIVVVMQYTVAKIQRHGGNRVSLTAFV
jgi:hypothetical protein